MLLAEYGITPDVFATATYSSPEVCDLHLRDLKEVMLREGLVRDFRAGEWARHLLEPSDRWDKRGKELVRKLMAQSRLIQAAPARAVAPVTDSDWCLEGLCSHRIVPLQGIIAGSRVAAEFEADQEVASIEALDRADWWHERRDSARVDRKTASYLTELSLVLKHANSLMFIDPHLDPEKYGYREFVKLLLACQREECPPLIEIHRVCYVGSKRERTVPRMIEWENKFAGVHGELKGANLSAKVFIWDDFHERFLISNLLGIHLGNGLEITGRPNDYTTWSRLDRETRDDLQREFDPSSARHHLCGSFWIGSHR